MSDRQLVVDRILNNDPRLISRYLLDAEFHVLVDTVAGEVVETLNIVSKNTKRIEDYNNAPVCVCGDNLMEHAPLNHPDNLKKTSWCILCDCDQFVQKEEGEG